MSAAENGHATLVGRWLNTIWPTIPTGEWLSIFAMTPDGQDRRTLWAETTGDAAKQIDAVTRTHNIWLGCATRTSRLGQQRGSAADCGHIPGLWLDVDIAGPHHTRQDLPPDTETAQQILDRYPLQPTVVINSGNGLQPWWLFKEPIRPADYPDLLDAWAYTWAQTFADAGYGLDNVFDLARVLRVAGTLNHKNTPPEPVTIHGLNPTRYEVDDLDQWLTTPPPKPAPPQTPAVPYIGPARPGDAFNTAHTGAAVLEHAGWEHARTDRNGDRHYRHPTATSPTSATVYADDGHTTIWTDSYPTLEPRRPYDPFGLYTALHHRGDWREATRQLSGQGYGAKDVTAADLYGLDQPPAAEHQQNRHTKALLTEDPLNRLAPPQPLPHGWLYRHSLAVIYGPPKKGKTFVAVDLAMSIATGHTWLGGQVEHGTVVYSLGEGVAGLPRRIKAWREERQINGPARIVLLPHAVQLADPIDVSNFLEAVEPYDPDLIVIDTLARASIGVEENSSKEMGVLIAQADRIKEQTGACVLLVHHTGKDAARGTRGSSALTGAIDTGIEVRGDTKAMTLVNTEQKDAEPADALQFRAKQVGESMVFVPTVDTSQASETVLSVMEALVEIDTGGVSTSAWIDQAAERGVPERTFRRSKKWLVDNGHVVNVGSVKRPVWTIDTHPTDTTESDF